MPRKDRKPAPTLAERHREIAHDFRFVGLDRLDAPAGAWQVDSIIALIDPAAPKNTRQLACDAAYRAFGATSSEYEVAAQRGVDLQRAAAAERLARSVAEFTQLEFTEQSNGDSVANRIDRVPFGDTPFDMAPLYRAAHDLQARLGEYARHRRKEPPGNARDKLAEAFAAEVRDLWDDLGWPPKPASNMHRFALALWKDVGFPPPDDVEARGNGEDWMRAQFR